MNKNDHERLRDTIKDIQFTMMTTIDSQGKMHSRPMATMAFDDVNDFEGVLWFFTKKDSVKVHEIELDKEVNLSYADPGSQRYVSVSGFASIEADKLRMMQFWKPTLKAWFPEGLDDPQLTLIKVEVDSAEIWDSPPSKVVKLVGIAKSMMTGKPYEDPKIESHHLGRSH